MMLIAVPVTPLSSATSIQTWLDELRQARQRYRDDSEEASTLDRHIEMGEEWLEAALVKSR